MQQIKCLISIDIVPKWGTYIYRIAIS